MRRRLSYANVMATSAFLFALTGGAIAGEAMVLGSGFGIDKYWHLAYASRGVQVYALD